EPGERGGTGEVHTDAELGVGHHLFDVFAIVGKLLVGNPFYGVETNLLAGPAKKRDQRWQATLKIETSQGKQYADALAVVFKLIEVGRQWPKWIARHLPDGRMSQEWIVMGQEPQQLF